MRTSIRKPSDLIDYHKKQRFNNKSDQKIREKFVSADMYPTESIVAECDELIRRGVAELQAEWTEEDMEARRGRRPELEIHQIEVHHTTDGVLTWRAVG